MPVQIIEDKKENNLCNQYLAECPFCHSKITYLGLDISFHRNYPNGYVYCPKCRRPIAHNEENIFDNGKPAEEIKQIAIEELEKQKMEAAKSKNVATIIGSIFMLGAVVALAIGAIGIAKDVAFVALFFVAFILLMFSILFFVAIGNPSYERAEKIDKQLKEIEEKDA